MLTRVYTCDLAVHRARATGSTARGLFRSIHRVRIYTILCAHLTHDVRCKPIALAAVYRARVSTLRRVAVCRLFAEWKKKTGLNRAVSRFTHGHRTQFDVVAEGACGLDTPPPVKRDFIAIAARAHPRSIKIFGVIFFYQWKFNFNFSIFTNLSLSKRLICVLQKYVVG